MLFVILCLVILLPTSKSCDVCGCGVSNMGIGLLTNYRNNFLRISYFNTSFQSVAAYENTVSDYFHQFDLSLRYALSQRWKIDAQIPFRINNRISPTENLQELGLSDIRLNANYALIQNGLLANNTTIYLELGAGLSLPTGRFDPQLHDRNLPENFNVGKGSLGYITQSNVVLNAGKFGTLWSGSYQYQTTTKEGYRFGNQFNTQLTFFREFQFKSKEYQYVPSLGINYESIEQDRYANSNQVHGTGGQGLFISPAINLKTTNFLLGVAYFIPLAESYSSQEVAAKGRLSFQCSYIF